MKTKNSQHLFMEEFIIPYWEGTYYDGLIENNEPLYVNDYNRLDRVIQKLNPQLRKKFAKQVKNGWSSVDEKTINELKEKLPKFRSYQEFYDDTTILSEEAIKDTTNIITQLDTDEKRIPKTLAVAISRTTFTKPQKITRKTIEFTDKAGNPLKITPENIDDYITIQDCKQTTKKSPSIDHEYLLGEVLPAIQSEDISKSLQCKSPRLITPDKKEYFGKQVTKEEEFTDGFRLLVFGWKQPKTKK